MSQLTPELLEAMKKNQGSYYLDNQTVLDEVKALEAERDASKAELEQYKSAKQGYYKDSDVAKMEAEISRLKAECEKSHKSFDSLHDDFMKTSKMLTEACMKNKSLWEQFNLWKVERDHFKSLATQAKGALGLAVQALEWASDHDKTPTYKNNEQPPRGKPIGPNESAMTPKEIGDVYIHQIKRTLDLFSGEDGV